MTTEALTSAQNPLLKAVRRAIARGTLTDAGFCVAEGLHLLDEAARSGCEIGAVLCAEFAHKDACQRQALNGIRLHVLPDSLFTGISTTEASQGVIGLVRVPSWTLDQVMRQDGLTMVLDGVQEPGNAGAIVRSAEAFGAAGVIFLKGTVSPHNPKTLRAAAGSLFRLPHAHGVEDTPFRHALEQNRLRMFAADSSGKTLIQDADLGTPGVILIGSEGRGIRPDLRRDAVGLRIPTRAVESLNAAVAAAVILYEAQRQRMGR